MLAIEAADWRCLVLQWKSFNIVLYYSAWKTDVTVISPRDTREISTAKR